jgi:hypothetical protein
MMDAIVSEYKTQLIFKKDKQAPTGFSLSKA